MGSEPTYQDTLTSLAFEVNPNLVYSSLKFITNRTKFLRMSLSNKRFPTPVLLLKIVNCEVRCLSRSEALKKLACTMNFKYNLKIIFKSLDK